MQLHTNRNKDGCFGSCQLYDQSMMYHVAYGMTDAHSCKHIIGFLFMSQNDISSHLMKVIGTKKSMIILRFDHIYNMSYYCGMVWRYSYLFWERSLNGYLLHDLVSLLLRWFWLLFFRCYDFILFVRCEIVYSLQCGFFLSWLLFFFSR